MRLRPRITLLFGALALIAAAGSAPSQAVVPGEPGKLVFVVYSNAPYNVYVADSPTDEHWTNLTDSPNDEEWPKWSPDGRRIVFHRDPGGIYVMDADGSDQKMINSVGQSPSWSPDGKKIAYIKTSGTNGRRFHTMDVDGTRQRVLDADVIGGVSPAAWSPDGKFLALAGSIGSGSPAHIYVVNADGSGRKQLTETGGNSGPAWSPNGDHIAFSSDRDETTSDIWVMRTDGTGQKQLTSQGGITPAWSPDGKKIAFARSEGGYDRPYTMNADGTDVDPFAGEGTGSWRALQPDWQSVQSTAAPGTTASPKPQASATSAPQAPAVDDRDDEEPTASPSSTASVTPTPSSTASSSPSPEASLLTALPPPEEGESSSNGLFFALGIAALVAVAGGSIAFVRLRR